MSLRGIFPIMPTPFTDDDTVDEESLLTLVDFMKARDMDGMTVLGMMGEEPKLTEDEKELVIRTVIQAGDGLPVIAGTGAASTRLAIVQSLRAAELGVSGFLVAPPPTTNDQAIFDYYKGLSDAVELPIIIHDYPDVTNVTLSVPLIARMARVIPRVEYIKLEEAPTGKKITALRKEAGDTIAIFCALGGAYCLEELRRGAIGVMTGFAYPEILKEIHTKLDEGDEAGAEETFYRYVALIRYEFQPGLGLPLRKEIYRRRGAIKNARLRAPGPSLDPVHLEELDNMMTFLGLDGAR